MSFGGDIESVTIVVATFMLGLGIGALAGGWLADRWPQRILLLFAASEAGIGLFGLISVDAIRTLGHALAGAPSALAAAVNFVVLLVPTSMMGATLPMLVAHAARRSGNVGVSIGGLYFANTLGAAAGCYVIGFVWFARFDLPSAVQGAAALNLVVALAIALAVAALAVSRPDRTP